jgi:hypothetical protein
VTDQEVLTALRDIKARIDGAFDEDADKWQADKHLALEDIETKVDDLIDRLEGQ